MNPSQTMVNAVVTVLARCIIEICCKEVGVGTRHADGAESHGGCSGQFRGCRRGDEPPRPYEGRANGFVDQGVVPYAAQIAWTSGGSLEGCCVTGSAPSPVRAPAVPSSRASVGRKPLTDWSSQSRRFSAVQRRVCKRAAFVTTPQIRCSKFGPDERPRIGGKNHAPTVAICCSAAPPGPHNAPDCAGAISAARNRRRSGKAPPLIPWART